MRRLKTLVGAGSFAYAANNTDKRTGPQRAASLARTAEAARITGLFTADLLQTDPDGIGGTTGTQEPIVTLAALSAVTARIGLVATVSTTFTDPYTLARQIGTLDHVSGGRAAWNAVTSSVGEENFGGVLPMPAERYERAAEFIEVMNALFDANRPDAVQRGPSGAIKVDFRKLPAVRDQHVVRRGRRADRARVRRAMGRRPPGPRARPPLTTCGDPMMLARRLILALALFAPGASAWAADAPLSRRHVRRTLCGDKRVAELIEVYRSSEVKQFILDKFGGSIIPTW